MLVEEQVTINGSRAAIWGAITDIENAAKIMSGIEKIEVLEGPANGLVGLKWRETRMLFGKPAAVEKRITDAAEKEFYSTRAEDRGLAFLTTFRISESSSSITLTSSHDSRPEGIAARFMSMPMVLFTGVMKKAIVQDLNDIKDAVEKNSPTDGMKESGIATQGQFLLSLPEGDESDWIEFASLPVISGKLRVSDPMFFRDLPPAPTFDLECGTYRVMAKTMTYPGDKRVSRLRAFLKEPSTVGLRLDHVGVDFAQVGIFDPVILDEAGEKMDNADEQKMIADLCAIEEFGVVQLGNDERAIMPLAVSGFGDGGYPIHDLSLDGERVGLEVVFIGPEVLAC